MSAVQGSADEGHRVDEGSWVYLSYATDPVEGGAHLYERIADACEASGWLPISGTPSERWGPSGDTGRFFEGIRHAVEHADVVITLIGEATDMMAAELSLAYSHRRPIVGVRLSGASASEIQGMLESYERARVIVCSDADDCSAQLRATFADPDFVETVRHAASEHGEDA